MAKVRFGQSHARNAVNLDRLDRYEAHRIELVRHFKQKAVMMFCASGRRQRGPGGILLRDGELSGMLGFRIEPARNVFDEGRFRQRRIEQAFDLGGERGTVQRGGLIGSDAADRLFLNELALEGEQWLDVAVPGLQSADFRGDSEQIPQKILDVRREVDNQVGVPLARKRAGVCARLHESIEQRDIGGFQKFDEARVNAHQSLAMV